MHTRDSEKRLIEAVSKIIEQDGFAKLGINKIAREAGYDKVLIYRYFGGLDGLLEAWSTENDFYTAAYTTFYKEVKNAQIDEIRPLTKKILLGQLETMRSNILMQELLLWEISGKSKFKTIQNIREKNGNKLQQLFNDKLELQSEDINLHISLLIAGINFIVLCTRQYPVFNAINFNKAESWKKLETVLCNYIDMLFDNLEI